MILIVVLLGAAIAVFGLIGLVHPRALVHFVDKTMRSPKGIYLAIGSRIIFGLVLIFSAWEARFPLAFRILGILSLVTAAGIAVLGATRMQTFVTWWLNKSPGFIRAWSLIATGFGLFVMFNIL